MAGCEQDFDDQRFEVNDKLRCAICVGVVKDPLMCQNEENLFCRCCVLKHLQQSSTCPTCTGNLSADNLKPVPRLTRKPIDNHEIRCDNFAHGCREVTTLDELNRHVDESCWYSSVHCSNPGCNAVILRRDKADHENAICQFRRVNSCAYIDEIKADLRLVNEKLEKIQLNVEPMSNRINFLEQEVLSMKRKEEMRENQEETRSKVQNTDKSRKTMSAEVSKNIGKITEKTAKLFVACKDIEAEKFNIIVAGGHTSNAWLNSVEYYNTSANSWMTLQAMTKPRAAASSVLFNGHMIVAGGINDVTREDGMVNIGTNPVNPSETWHDYPGRLPLPSSGQASVLYNESLLSVGGLDDTGTPCDSIYEVMLSDPYEAKLLDRLPRRVCDHGAVLFGDKVVICGGTTTLSCKNSVKSVLQYDIGQGECKMLPRLPFAISSMAVVKHDNHVILVGGLDNGGNVLRSVVCYNIESGTSVMLPEMKYARAGCTAVVVGERIVVMGGCGDDENVATSVETFTFGSDAWEDMPDMKAARVAATAVSW